MAHKLPLFPLGIVLFPGVPLTLHIFEPRYRRMVADCQEGDRRFGIVPAGDGGGPPAPGAIGCIAELRGVQPLPDGRSNIVVTGERRCLVTRYLDEGTPYYLAMVEAFDDEPDSAPAPAALDALRALTQAYAGLLARVTDRDPGDVDLDDDAAALTFQVAALLECDPAIKQRLLALRSTDERAQLLLAVLPRLTAALGDAVRVHEKARTNGTGPHHPDVGQG